LGNALIPMCEIYVYWKVKIMTARGYRRRGMICLLIAICFAGIFPQELKGNDSNAVTLSLSNRYVFLPDVSTITQTGGVEGVNRQYAVKGQFQLYIDFQAKTASFAQVDVNAIDNSPYKRALNPNKIFNMTLLSGVVIKDTQILFTGRVADGSTVSITVTINDDLIYLTGQTTPPPNSADFFIFKLNAAAARKYSGGLGDDPPYKIATVQDLFELCSEPNDYNKNFIMTADVNLAGYTFNKALIAPYLDVNSWYPEYPFAFSGNFDGAGHKISNLKIVDNEGLCLGLFGVINAGTVSNLGLEAVDVNGADVNGAYIGFYTGSLAGWLYSGKISSCYSKGKVIGFTAVGGLVGENWVGSIISSYSTCNVFGGNAGSGSGTGGLVGDCVLGNITSCYSTGIVAGNGFVGGLAGDIDRQGSITTSYSTSIVLGLHDVGGLVGQSEGFINSSFSKGIVFCSGSKHGWDIGGLVGYNYGSIIYCYSTSPVMGSLYDAGGLVGSGEGNIAFSYSAGMVEGGNNTGGLVGFYFDKNKIFSCFWDTQTSGQPKSAGGTGKTTFEMQTEATFLDAGWDFIGEAQNGDQDIWWMVEAKRGQSNPTYPRLWWEKTPKN
jgi:hypothetical protein